MELNRTERFSSEDKPADRSLASREGLSGIVGLDPWKKPYRYEFLKNNQFLVVWSAGPNGRWDSLQTLPQLRGDDIGHLVDLNLNH